MKLILNKLIINNFKGIKNLTIEFDPFNTAIYAANEVGKTTVSDAWHWLLTGKNSIDQKDFNIKNTVDTSLNRADHEVSGFITSNGREIILKKVYKEKWQKKRGSEATEFTGNETLYFFDEVPLSQNEYQAKINGLLSESVLKMITNPLFFNSNTTNWGWQKRREVLLTLSGNISDREIFESITTAENQQEVANLEKILNSGKTLQEFKLQIGSQKKKLKDELAYIPARIDETTRMKPEELNWSAILSDIQAKNAEIAKIDGSIADSAKAAQSQNALLTEHQNKIHQLTTRKNEISFRVSSELNTAATQRTLKKNELANEISSLDRAISYANSKKQELSSRRDILNKEVAELRERWAKVNATQIKFNDHEFTCPTCLRAFDESDIEARKETLTSNFTSNKASQLEEINKNGAWKVKQIADLEAEISIQESAIKKHEDGKTTFESELATLTGSVSENQQGLDSILSGNDEYVQITADLSKLTNNPPHVQQPDNSELISKKSALNMELDSLKKQLNTKDQIQVAEARIAELSAEEKKLSQQLADLERTEFLMETFDRTKMDIMEARVNGKFKYVTFKLFDRQVNGGEAPTCETMYKGVPFSDLNTAGRIWAGMDIINTLSEFYEVSAPIFLDNRESVSNIPETSSQVINLVVSPADKKIRIETGSEHLAVA